jgi:ParB family chromosome partitioning protein
MARKTGLGRGLEALIPGGSESEQDGAGVRLIQVEQIAPNPRQPRARIDPQELAELATSIREHGVIQPLIVTYEPELGQFVLIAGERRWLAARQAGLERVPVLVREATDQQRLELALVENVQRADLNPLEAAEAFRQLADEFGMPHEAIAARVGKSRAAVTNTLRLLKLPPAVQSALMDGQISEGHARALLMLPTPQAQAAALQTILAHGLNVRQSEELVRRLVGQRQAAPSKPPRPPELSDLEERLRTNLGTRVDVNKHKKGGTIVIHFYSDEELDTLISLLDQDKS